MKITIGIAIGLAVLITVMSTDVSGQQSSDTPQPLIVGTKEAPPFSMKTSDGQWTGLSIELWRQIAAELNFRFEFKELTLKQLLGGVTDGSLDAAVAALTITPEREKKFDFTHAFYTTGLGIAVASQSAKSLVYRGPRIYFGFISQGRGQPDARSYWAWGYWSGGLSTRETPNSSTAAPPGASDPDFGGLPSP